jgi:mycothiol synthase
VWRPLQLGDTEPLLALVQVIEAADEAQERTSIGEVVEILTGPWIDLAEDTLGGFDDSGTIRAYAIVEAPPADSLLRVYLHGAVHPAWRGRGIGRAVLAWLEGRGRQKLAASGKNLPARLAVLVEEKARDHRRLYAAAGFSPVRWYTTMRRNLATPLPAARAPEGLRIVPWDAALDEQVRLAHNEAFADHWGSQPQSRELWTRRDAHFAPAWSFVALDSSGGTPEVAGYLTSGRYDQDWDVQGYTCGYTDLLGVRRPWRGRGLAASLLVTAMEAYRADGIEYASLRVDTANPTGARGLYERLGYEATHGFVLYSVEI